MMMKDTINRAVERVQRILAAKDPECANPADILADVMHYCHTQSKWRSFKEELRTAQSIVEVEIEEAKEEEENRVVTQNE
jgi:hypothetical protein